SEPIQDPSPLRFPFYTVDGVPLTNGRQRDVTDGGEQGVMWGIAPSSDDRYLWISDQENNRVFRVVNPVPPTPAGPTLTPTPTFTRTPTGTPPTATDTDTPSDTPTGTIVPTATLTPPRVDIV